jgi:hypothetical protein
MSSRCTQFIGVALLIAGLLAFPSSALAGDAKAYIKVVSQPWETKPPLPAKRMLSYSIKNDNLHKSILVVYSIFLDGKRSEGGSKLLGPREGFPIPSDTSLRSQLIKIESATFQ